MKRLTAASPGTVISSPTCFSSREHIIGVSVSETTADVTTAIVKRQREFAEHAADQAGHEQ